MLVEPQVTLRAAHGVLVRFVPDAVVGEGPQKRLRGAFAFLPDPEGPPPMDDWPAYIAGLIGQGVLGFTSMGGQIQSRVTHALHDATPGGLAAASRLWKALMCATSNAPLDAVTLAVLNAARDPAICRAAAGACAVLSTPAQDLAESFKIARRLAVHDALALDAAVGLKKALRLSPTGAPAVSRVSALLRGAQLLGALPMDRSRKLGLHGAALDPQPLPRRRLAYLFGGELGKDFGPRNKNQKDDQPQDDAPPPEDAYLEAIARKGLAAALQAGPSVSIDAHGETEPFRRDPPPPKPDLRLPKRLEDLLAARRGELAVAARAAHDARTSQHNGKDATVARNSIDAEALAWLAGDASTATDQAGLVLSQSLQKLLAQHMLATRPDGGFDANLKFVETNSGEKIPHDVVRATLNDLGDTGQRRFFGLYAYPALARVLKVVVDVEIELGGEDLKGLTLVGGAIGGGSGTDLWTVCRAEARRVAIAGRQEAVAMSAALDPLAEADKGLEVPRYQGVWNLGVEDASGTPRFTLTSLDGSAEAEELSHQARSSATMERTAMGLGEASNGQAPARTQGLILYDEMRASAAQANATDAQDAIDRRRNGKPCLLYADDLSMGVRVDVGVDSRATVPGLSGRQWRSLLRREVRFGDVRDGVGKIDVEGLIETVLAISAPGKDAVERMANAAAFRRRLDEGALKPASRLVSDGPQTHEKPKASEGVASESLAQWNGDPLGVSCAAGDETPEDEGEVLVDRDLPISVTFRLETGGAARPPRLEIGRVFRFGGRDAYPGGLGPTLDAVESLYGGGTVILPRDDRRDIPYLRQDRVGRPQVARLNDAYRAPDGPGDTLTAMAVTTADSGSRDRTSRIVFAPALPLSLAAAHPRPAHLVPENATKPEKDILKAAADRWAKAQGADERRAVRALDGMPILRGRPLGGLVNVALDARGGGLPARKAGALFSPQESSWTSLGERKAHYYPDPAVETLIFQLWTKDAAPQPVPGMRVEVPLYSVAHLQRMPRRDGGAEWRPCVYPFAMPAFVETRRGDERSMTFDLSNDVGVIDSNGKFRARGFGYRGAPGEVTATRLRIVLARADDFELRVWCGVPDERAAWFAPVEQSLKLVHAVAVKGAARQPKRSEFVSAAQIWLGANVGVRVAETEAEATVLDSQPNALAIAEAVIAPKLVAKIAASHRAAALPEMGEPLTLSVAHAVQRPEKPQFEVPPKAKKALVNVNESSRALAVLRKDISLEDWPAWLAANANWDEKSEAGATQAWIGGDIDFDITGADRLALEVTWPLAEDPEGQPVRLRDGLAKGFRPRPLTAEDFPLSAPVILDKPFPDERGLTPHEGEKLRELILERSSEGVSRNLFLQLDSRAHRLLVTPVAHSRFSRRMPKRDASASDAAYFSTRGETKVIWALATKRPAPMGHVDMLPAFTWTKTERGASGVVRKTLVRLSWRRPRKAQPGQRTEKAMGAWYSTGPEERLGIVLPIKGESFEPGHNGTDFGRAEPFISRWGRDAIRTTAKVGWDFDDKTFAGNPSTVDQIPMPLPGMNGEETSGESRPVKLLTFAPIYDPQQDIWYVDVEIDPATQAGPWVRLGLVRYQQHALVRAKEGNNPLVDLRVSTPTTIEFRLEPYREVAVDVGPKVDGRWPVNVAVYGPSAVVNGGIGRQVKTEAALNELLADLKRPRFKASILRQPPGLFDQVSGAGHEVVAFRTSDTSLPPAADALWKETIWLEKSPFNTPHNLFLEEVDMMMPANPELEPDLMIESGPRFMAHVKLVKRAGAS